MRSCYLATVAAFAAVLAASTAKAAPPVEIHVPRGTVIIPGSSLPQPGRPDLAHTNFRIFVPARRHMGSSSPTGGYETPASLACLAGLTKTPATCNVLTLKTVATTGSKVIAIVDAFDDPNAAKDLNVYSKQFGLPAITSSNFEVVYASGKKPGTDPAGDWEVEESLDMDMAHALAPNAKIILVEAAEPTLIALFKAEKVAFDLVSKAGGGEVTNSWGSNEYKTEAELTKWFEGTNVVAFAASGDNPGVSEPAVLPNVVGVGGTTVNRKTNGDFIAQSSWVSGGGSISHYLPTPAYQSTVTSIVGSKRGTPDLAFVANPASGVWVYDTYPYQGETLNWVVVGGTSAASPAAAAIVNSAGSFNANGTAELTEIYANLGNAKAYYDVTVGLCENAASGRAGVGYDLCTGVGTPYGLTGK